MWAVHGFYLEKVTEKCEFLLLGYVIIKVFTALLATYLHFFHRG